MELVIARNLLERGRAAFLFKDNEVTDEIQEAAFLEHTFQQHFQLRDRSGRGGLAFDGLPRQEPFLVGRDRADAGIQAIGDDEQFVVVKQGRDVVLVGLQLIERRPDRSLFICGVLEFDDRQRQTVDEDHHIRSPVDLAVLVRGFHGVLIDDQPVVVFDVLEIHHIDPPADHAPVCVRTRTGRPIFGFVLRTATLVIYFDAVDQHVMKGVVVEQERRIAESHDLCVGLLPVPVAGISGLIRAMASCKRRMQKRFLIVTAFRRFAIESDLWTKGIGIAQVFEPVYGGFFNGGFGEFGHGLEL